MTLDPYAGREQAFVKHTVLKQYLTELALKLGQASRVGLTLHYVDGFAGPWKAATEDLSDTSPGIALSVLDSVRRQLLDQGRPVKIRCLFIEKSASSHADLQHLLQRFPEIEARALQGTFEGSIDSVREFISAGVDRFAFVFIDPIGWTGFGLDRLKPIFEVSRGELLINFMTNAIKRFPSNPASAASLRLLFGGDDFRSCADLDGLDREDCLVSTYCTAIERMVGLTYCVSAVVLNPHEERTHYHLIYATNSLVGLEAFRGVEARAMGVQDVVRGGARHRRLRERNPQQDLLFGPSAWKSSYADELIARYHPKAQAALGRLLSERSDVLYDDAVGVALCFPMTRMAVVNTWLAAMQREGRLKFVGLPPGARVPKLNSGHRLIVGR
jgi:three-Cys-motif partner protein